MPTMPLSPTQAANLRRALAQRDDTARTAQQAQRVLDVYIQALVDGLAVPVPDGTSIGLATDGSDALAWPDAADPPALKEA